jgi:hypothetical protein
LAAVADVAVVTIAVVTIAVVTVAVVTVLLLLFLPLAASALDHVLVVCSRLATRRPRDRGCRNIGFPTNLTMAR